MIKNIKFFQEMIKNNGILSKNLIIILLELVMTINLFQIKKK